MNKKILSAAVLAGLAGSASAVNLNHDGLGQILLYPYYTTTDGKTTEVHVVNTTGDFKAVKVRFNEGVNTWEVRDFNLYLSPYDVWTAVIDLDADGNPRVKTMDTSCTAPKFPTKIDDNWSSVGFSDVNLNLAGSSDVPGNTISNADRLKEGHLEIIEMGVVTDPALKTAIEHVNNVPGDCAAVRNAFGRNGIWNNNAYDTLNAGMSAPTGGLMGSGTIADLADASVLGYDPVAIEGFFTQAVHARPGHSFPSLTGHIFTDSSATTTTPSGIQVASSVSNVVNNNQVFTTQWATPAQALSAVLMASQVNNEVYNEGDFGTTDWVVTFPNKHAFVNPNTSGTSGTNGQFGFGVNTAPFANGFTVPLNQKDWNTEEFSRVDPTVLNFSPTPPAGAAPGLSNEVNILEMSAEFGRSVFGSALKQEINVPHKQGWARLDFAGNPMVGQELDANGVATGRSHTFDGFPVIGFAAIEVKNDAIAAGVKARYAASYDHKYRRTITVAS